MLRLRKKKMEKCYSSSWRWKLNMDWEIWFALQFWWLHCDFAALIRELRIKNSPGQKRFRNNSEAFIKCECSHKSLSKLLPHVQLFRTIHFGDIWEQIASVNRVNIDGKLNVNVIRRFRRRIFMNHHKNWEWDATECSNGTMVQNKQTN